MTRALLTIVLIAATACAHSGAATTGQGDAPTLEQLYVAERHGELLLSAEAVLAAEDAPRERVAEARFYRALVWLGREPPSRRGRALHELRRLEFEYDDLLWGRLAGLQVAAALQIDALQATLLELALERRDLQVRVDALAQRLAEAEAALARAQVEAGKHERERGELRDQLEAARIQLAAMAARLAELEAELAALKQIDMQREP